MANHREALPPGRWAREDHLRESADSVTLGYQARESVESWTPQHQPRDSAESWTPQHQEQDIVPLKPLNLVRAAFQDGPPSRSPSTRSTASAQSREGEYFRYRTMVIFLANRISASGWMPQAALLDPSYRLGVLLRQTRGQYSCYPDNIHRPLLNAVQRLNVGVAVAMRPEMVSGIIANLAPGQMELRLRDGSQIQIIESFSSITVANVKKFQYSCLLRNEEALLVWQDDLQQILGHAQRTEDKLLAYVWGSTAVPMGFPMGLPMPHTPLHSPAASVSNFSMYPEKSSHIYNQTNESTEEIDPDGGPDKPESLARPVMMHSSVFVGLGMALTIVLVYGFSIGQVVSEVIMDGSYSRLGLLTFSPLLMFAGLFFFQVIFSNLWQMFGPIGGFSTNSRFYSCIKPNLRQAYALGFSPPHITIQMPVYREGLDSVIVPTVKSLQAAISHYESRGGSASIFVNDDGMQVISPDEASLRREFYHDNNIGWVSRPKHGYEGFVRKGKFKKASNMNFALNISQKVETHMKEAIAGRAAAMQRQQKGELHTEQELEDIYQESLEHVLRENPLAKAEGNIRMGEFILIIDSDTRVPVDCLIYGAAEMFLSPEVAIVQHSTGVMQVTWDYFENAITFFTNMVYSAIRFSISCGEVAPFVGHNAFLRWAALQDVGVVEENGYIAYWSESHVSEDFDIALRVQINGNIVRVASYHGDGFQEGVSLTIYDEIARWQKYAYGCSEMIFNPIHRWPVKGPFTKLLATFLGSNMLISSKIAIFAYICSYFAIGCGLPMTVANYFLVGWFDDYLDHLYLSSWKVFVSLVVVFNISGGLSLAVVRYRTGERSLLGSLFENFKWMPVMAIFFGGLSFHVSAALLAHLFHVDMQWGATSKEKENSNFFQEIPKILKVFKFMYIFIVLFSGAMIYLSVWAPHAWAVTDFTAIIPMAIVLGSHAITPLVLNPSLMVFNY